MNNSESSSYDESSQLSQNSSLIHEQNLQEQQQMIKEQLKQIPYGQILKHQRANETQKNSLIMHNKKEKKNKIKKIDKNNEKQQSNKYAPQQIKIMKMPPKKKIKPIFQQRRKPGIDPRFEEYAGNFNADLATKTYSFIGEKQKQQANQLKKKIHNRKTKEQDRTILLKNYNQITNDMKRFQNSKIQQQVKAKYKNNIYKPKKRQLNQQIQKAKLSKMSHKDQDKRLKKKQKKIQKQRIIERKRMTAFPNK